MVFNKVRSPTGTQVLQPGPLRLSLDNRSDTRVLPSVWIAADRLHDLLGRRKPFLTARRLLSNQTFRDLYHTDTLDIDQRLKITSLTFLFTDLRSSTELYERVGDLVAFDLVRSHFRVLLDIVAEESGAVIKTIGDAVMATFLSPDQAVKAALRMREGMRLFNAAHGPSDLSLKIGLHEGPCLAVLLNERQDFFRPDRQCRVSCAGRGELHRDPRHRRHRAQYGGGRVARTQRNRAGTAPDYATRPRRGGHALRNPLSNSRPPASRMLTATSTGSPAPSNSPGTCTAGLKPCRRPSWPAESQRIDPPPPELSNAIRRDQSDAARTLHTRRRLTRSGCDRVRGAIEYL